MRARAFVWWVLWEAIRLLCVPLTASAQEDPKLETLGEYTRLQIPVSGGSSFRMMSGKGGEVTLLVDRVFPAALDALAGLRDERVSQVSVRAVGLDKAEIAVRFRDPRTESFAYRQGDTLVLDLWRGGASSEADAVGASVQGRKPAAAAASAGKVEPQPRAAEPMRAAAPAPARETGKASPRVEPLRIDRDLFQKFLLPLPDLRVAGGEGGLDLPLSFQLETSWSFGQGDRKTEDGRGFELAKSLFEARKFGLCLKTAEIVLRDHPKTVHAGELAFLRALSYWKLGEAAGSEPLLSRGNKMLEELAARRDQAGRPFPFHRLIALHFAKAELGRENWLQAIQHLEQASAATTQDDPEFPYLQILLAESYAKVSQPRRAERLYRFLTEKFPKHVLAREAAYRIAGLLALEKNYRRVVEEGEAALRAYPGHEKARSEALFHMGEAYFWMARYDKAEKSFRRYAEIASAQTTAGLAWVRLGEIEELRRSSLSRARESYLRAKNGYPFSWGGLAATVRLARLDLPTEKEPGFAVSSLREVIADKGTDWELRRMAELVLIDYLLQTGQIDEAIALAGKGMAQSEGVAYSRYQRAYERSLFARLEKLARDGRFAEGLALYEREKKWLEEYGPETYRVASGIYRGLGLYSAANKLIERYGAGLARRGRAPASAPREAAGLSREKAANSFAEGAYAATLAQLGGRDDALSLYMRAVSHFRLGQKAAAYSAAARAVPRIRAEREGLSDDRIESLAEILIERDDSERDFARMGRDVEALRALCSRDSERLSFASADALWYRKSHREAEKAYKEALAKFPQGARADRARYNLGISLVAQGKRDEAVKLLTSLKESGQGVWPESAKQELELIEWERKYSSVLRTLPPGGLGIAN